MKKFNKEITVSVSVDSIAEHLLGTFAEDSKHREMIAETIVGTLLENDRLNDLYNSLNGYTNEINFEVGDEVECTEKQWQYKTVHCTDTTSLLMQNVVVTEINPFARRNKLKVSYTTRKKESEQTEQREVWVKHTSCDKITIEAPEHSEDE